MVKKTLYLLAELSDRDFEWLIGVGKRTSLTAGSTLIREGEPINAVYVLLAGELSVLVEALNNEEIATLGKGEIVGEISFVDSRPPSATVKAKVDCSLWTIPRVELVNKLNMDIGFAANWYKGLAMLLADRLRSTVSRFSYDQGGKEGDQSSAAAEMPMNPDLEQVIELAQLRLDWLMKQFSTPR